MKDGGYQNDLPDYLSRPAASPEYRPKVTGKNIFFRGAISHHGAKG